MSSNRQQCEVKGCSAVAAKNLPCCREHKCDEESCTATVALTEDKKSRYELCPSHKCSFTGCSFRRVPGFDGCSGQTDHTCQIIKCQNVILDRDHILCLQHISLECSEDGCSLLATKKGAERQPYCTSHIKCKNCTNPRIAQSSCCNTHTCWRRGCNKSVRKGAFCEDHKCSAEKCLQAPMVSETGVFRKTCFIHTCQFPNCSEINKVEKIGYCQTHCCVQGGCTRYRCDHLDLSSTAEHLCLQHHDEKLKAEEQARVDQKAQADEKLRAEEQAKADKKAEAAATAKVKEDAEAEEKSKAEEKIKAEEKAKADAKLREEEKAKAEKAKLQAAKEASEKDTSIVALVNSTSTTIDDLKKLLEALQKSQETSFADVKTSLKQIDEFDRQTILALAKRNK